MNLPNKLTILRIIMIPFFVLFMLLDGGVSQTYRYIAAIFPSSKSVKLATMKMTAAI